MAFDFVAGIQSQDPQILERIIDWDRYYKSQEIESGNEEGWSAEEIEKQKNILLTVLARDRGLAVMYLTAENTIDRVSVQGSEATVDVVQKDRSTGEKRMVTLLMNKVEDDAWKIYRFSTKKLGAD